MNIGRRNQVEVVLRIKPPTSPNQKPSVRPHEDLNTTIFRYDPHNSNAITISDPQNVDRAEREYLFNRIIRESSTQVDVFDTVCLPLVERVFDGFNCCCFAYGQTGSGKTYSVFGKNADPRGDYRGILPRAVERIFSTIERRRTKPPSQRTAAGINSSSIGTSTADVQYRVYVSFLEIYMDTVGDLGRVYLEDKISKRELFSSSSEAAAASANNMSLIMGVNLRNSETPTTPNRSRRGHRDSISEWSAIMGNTANGGNNTPSNTNANTTSSNNNANSGNTNSLISSQQPPLWGIGTMFKSLDIRETQEGRVYVKDLSVIHVNSVEQVLEIIDLGVSKRATFETQMNEYSSRSHTVFTITVVQIPNNNNNNNNNNNTNNNNESQMSFAIKGSLNIVDLAGSERLKKSESEGMRLKEAVTINKSLSALGNVILGLYHNLQHIPYRDSKLTRILQDSLGGNSYTTMLINLSPAVDNYEESLATLQFAYRCKNVQNNPKVNFVDINPNALGMSNMIGYPGAGMDTPNRASQQNKQRIHKLQGTIRELQTELEESKNRVQQLEDEIATLSRAYRENSNRPFVYQSDDKNRSISMDASGVIHNKLENEKTAFQLKLMKAESALSRSQHSLVSVGNRYKSILSNYKDRITQLTSDMHDLKIEFEQNVQAKEREKHVEVERINRANAELVDRMNELLRSIPENFRNIGDDNWHRESIVAAAQVNTEKRFINLLKEVDKSNDKTLQDMKAMYESVIEKLQRDLKTAQQSLESLQHIHSESAAKTDQEVVLFYQYTSKLNYIIDTLLQNPISLTVAQSLLEAKQLVLSATDPRGPPRNELISQLKQALKRVDDFVSKLETVPQLTNRSVSQLSTESSVEFGQPPNSTKSQLLMQQRRRPHSATLSITTSTRGKASMSSQYDCEHLTNGNRRSPNRLSARPVSRQMHFAAARVNDRKYGSDGEDSGSQSPHQTDMQPSDVSGDARYRTLFLEEQKRYKELRIAFEALKRENETLRNSVTAGQKRSLKRM